MIEIMVYGFLLLLALFVLAVRGRTGQTGLTELKKWSYAHRGLHGKGLPENSMAAFQAALEKGYGIELDVHLLADGNLAVIHDSSLKRTVGRDVQIEDLTVGDLESCHLEGTDESIPTLEAVLELFQGKAPLVVELKPARGNHDELARKTCEVLDRYDVTYCMESFDPRCIYWLRKNRPQIIRGQLTENYFASKSPLPGVLKFLLKHQLENFLTVPDFVAYRFTDRKNLSNFLVRKIWGVQGVTWTLKTQAEYDTAVREGYIPIFEGFEP